MTPHTDPTSSVISPKSRRARSGFHKPTDKGVHFTVAEYFKMDRAGVFDDGRVELLLGRVFPMNAQANPHRWAISKASRKLQQLFPYTSYWVVVQGTLVLGEHGAPDPDFHVLDVPEGTPDADLPRPFLVIEISDTTYRKDSGIKLVQYASAGIPDYWIANIPARRIEVYRTPDAHAGKDGGWGYGHRSQFTPGTSIALLGRPDLSIAVTDILP